MSRTACLAARPPARGAPVRVLVMKARLIAGVLFFSVLQRGVCARRHRAGDHQLRQRQRTRDGPVRRGGRRRAGHRARQTDTNVTAEAGDRWGRALPVSVPEGRAVRNHRPSGGIRGRHAPADAHGRRGVRAAGVARGRRAWRRASPSPARRSCSRRRAARSPARSRRPRSGTCR